jgi:asparagine synthase (glutamine-hydrolysing)
VSAIAALFARDSKRVQSRAVTAMLNAVPYRALDGCGTRVLDSVGLGHAYTMRTPEEDESERLPLTSPRSGCVLVADVRLDNRSELLGELAVGIPAISDRKLLLRAYDHWGTGAFERLLGDFAVIVWDPRHHRLVCARDTSGQRTLFYSVNATSFAAASEIHQLLQDAAAPIGPDDERIHDYLVELQVGRNEKDHPRTFYAGVSALPAGHILEVEPVKLRVRRFWTLKPGPEIRYGTDTEYEEHFRTLLFDAVRARLRSRQPPGALLSGGLDSASVVCAAQEMARRADVAEADMPTTFTATYPGLVCDERQLVEDMRQMHGFDARFVAAGQGGMRLRLQADGFLEAPSVWTGAERDALLGAAAAAGVRVLLTGEVADSCVGGSRLVFDSLLRHGDWRSLWHNLVAYRRVSSEPLRKIAALHCLAPLLPLGLQIQVELWYARRLFERSRPYLFPDWVPESLREDLRARLLAQVQSEERQRRFSSPARELEYRLLNPPEVARHFAPWPIEMRRPFADRRLHAFLLAIPPEQKFRPHPDGNGFYAGSKSLLRRAMRGTLPESVRTRTTKTVFGASFVDEVRQQWSTYESAFGPRGEARIANRGYVDGRRFWEQLEGVVRGDESADLMWVSRLVELETWLRSLELARPTSVRVASAKPHSVEEPFTGVRPPHVQAESHGTLFLKEGGESNQARLQATTAHEVR